jgi:membrane associated rhomboid family serine protease
MLAVWVLELVVFDRAPDLAERLFEIRSDRVAWMGSLVPMWLVEPWTLVTSTLSHHPARPMHLLLNGLFLFFFGPVVERLTGVRRFLILFFVAGALTGVAQVELSRALGSGLPALGASGALMMLFGMLVALLPREKIHLYGILPLPMWVAGIVFAVLDLIGALNPRSDVGNFAHLAGMALGLAYGIHMLGDLKRRGLRLTRA